MPQPSPASGEPSLQELHRRAGDAHHATLPSAERQVKVAAGTDAAELLFFPRSDSRIRHPRSEVVACPSRLSSIILNLMLRGLLGTNLDSALSEEFLQVIELERAWDG